MLATPYILPTNDATSRPFTGPLHAIRARAKIVGAHGRYSAGIKWSGEWLDAVVHEEQLAILRADAAIEVDDGSRPAERPLNDTQAEDIVPALAFAKAAKAEEAKAEAKADAELEAATAPTPAPALAKVETRPAPSPELPAKAKK